MKASATVAKTKTSAAKKSVSKAKPSPSLKVTEQTPIASAVVSEIPSRSIVELTGSVTKDEAVALLLGWSVDPKRSAFVSLDRFGITEEQFRTLPSMGQSVNEILTDQLNAAEDVAQHANFLLSNGKEPASYLTEAEAKDFRFILADAKTMATEAQAKIARCNQMINEAARFTRDITTEYNKNKSQLQPATPDDVTDGRILITLDSLNQWALKKYKFSIKAGRPLKMKSLFEADGCEADDYGRAKVKNMLVILALMAELYAQIAPRYRQHESQAMNDDDGNEADPSFNAIGDRVAKHALKRFGAGSSDAQDAQIIRKLLSLAASELMERQI
jgi:hypothetical protein